MGRFEATCPDDGVLAAFVERALADEDRDAVEAHLDRCSSCRQTIAHVAAAAGGGAGEPRRLGRYRLDRVLGSGGMGVVWQAWDPALERGLAIKLLRPELTDDHGRARLIREARALAKLQHPNVVAVHDVGELAGEVFIATELIEGEAMDRWQRGRAPAEVIAAYAQAARGLAAAHGLGLVHRDVKPSNLLVGRDGRVRVGDFGLATRDLARAPTDPGGSDPAPEARLTHDGELVGTPAYMAPEQRARGPVDARADQFALCVALVEALRGTRPAAGTTAAELAAGAAPAPWDAIARGLAVRPDDRHRDLAPLIAALDGAGAAPRRRRRALALVGAAVVVAAAGTGAVLRAGGADPVAACALRRPLAGVWEPATRDALAAAFRARQPVYGPDAARAVAAALDAHVAAHEAEDRAACEDAATGRQPPDVADRRAGCLERLRVQLAVLVDQLAAPDPAAIQRAPASARALPAPSTCNTPAGLADRTVPRDLVGAARAEVLSAQVTHARALRHLGKLAAARAAAERAVAGARSAGALLELAEAQQELATILHAQDDGATERVLGEALATAAEAHADFRAARVSALLVELAGREGDVAAAERQAGLARTAIIRAGGPDPQLEAIIERGLGHAHQVAHKYARAYERYAAAERLHASIGARDDVDFDRRAQVLALINLDRFAEATRINERVLASDRANLGPKHPRTIGDLISGSTIHVRAGRYAEAVPVLASALALEDEVFGVATLRGASIRARLGAAQLALGRVEEAERLHRAALAVLAAKLPPSALEVRGQRINLAGVLTTLGRYADADAELVRVVEASRAARDDETCALALQNLADNRSLAGRYAEALEAAQESLARNIVVFGVVSRRGAEAHAALGNAYAGLRRHAEAATAYRRALEQLEPIVGPAAPQLGEPLIGLGLVHLARGDAAAARPLLERAARVLAQADPVELARARFALARALAAQGARAAARTEAEAARAAYAAAGDRARARRAEVEAWLGARGTRDR